MTTTTTPIIEGFMTELPHTIGRDQPVSVAKEMMSRYGVRDLPVLEGGKLVGVWSERDIAFFCGVRVVDVNTLSVGEAMSSDVYTVGSTAPLATVVANMARHRYGSAIVLEGNRVIGLFTTVDALRTLEQLLASGQDAVAGAPRRTQAGA
jgi:acetoin utilization protein AcuB